MIAVIAVLTPEILNNERARQVIEVLEKRKKEIFEKYCYWERERVENPKTGDGMWKFTGKKIIPVAGAEIPVENPKAFRSTSYVLQKGLWDIKVNQYWEEMVELYTDAYSELYLLASSKEVNYWKSKSGF
jgi:hypothetical protein